jgi:ketosteroid isomerase-like protein
MSWLLAVMLFVGAAQSEAPAATVARMWARYASLVVSHDADALAEMFTTDARLMQPNVDDVVGRELIRRVLKTSFSQGLRRSDTRMMPRDVVGFNDLIYDQGDFIETVAPSGNPRRAADTYGRYFAVWAEQPDGSWQLARLMISLRKQPGR